MTDTYSQIIDSGAEAIAAALRGNPLDGVDVWAVPANGGESGYIRPFNWATVNHVPAGARCVRPSDLGASTYHSWRSVPYSEIRHVLFLACRRDPVLPV